MENPNMMMPNGMPPQNMNTMQRPQQGNQQQQIHAKIMDELQKAHPTVGQGWQSTFDLRQRAMPIMQMYTALRVLQQHHSIWACLNIALTFEANTLAKSPNREVYVEQLKRKMSEIQQRRAQAAQQMQNGMMPPNQNMGLQPNGLPNMMPNNMNNMNGMNMMMNMQNGGMNMPNGQMSMDGNGAQQNLGFPAQLQRQMQPSPLPPQQQQQQQQQMTTMDPSMLQNTPSQPQMPNMTQPTPQQNAPSMPQGGSGPMPNEQMLEHMAKQTMATLTDQKKLELRQQLLSRVPEHERLAMQNSGHDPLLNLLKIRARANAMRQQAQGSQPNSNRMQMGGPPGNQQPNGQQGGGPNIDYIMGQQANALRQQESGETVVPASNNVNVGGGMGGTTNGGAQGINPQMLAGGNNQPGDPQLQQRMRNLMEEQRRQQFAQRQNMMAMQQAQSQASQLRGQPGGLNAPNALNGGPAGQAHSPAMSMLNRPMVPPGQAAPNTPQQQPRPATQPPQTPMNAATQNLMQHHQQMMHQNNGQMNQLGQGQPFDYAKRRQELLEITRELPQQYRTQIINNMTDPAKARMIVQRYHTQYPGQAPQQQQGGPVMGGPAGQQSSLPPNMANMNQPQTGVQQAGMGGAMPGQGMPVQMGPGPNMQPPNNQPNGQGSVDAMQVQRRLPPDAQARWAHQRAMDVQVLNKQILARLNLNVPPAVQRWAQLKQWVQSARDVLPPDTMQKVGLAQAAYYQANPHELQSAKAELMRRMASQNAQQQNAAHQPPQQPAAGVPQNLGQPNGGQAPPAQMVPPVAPMQQPNPTQQAPGGPQGQRPSGPPLPTRPSMEDVQQFRARVGAQLSQYSDEQVREILFEQQKRAYGQRVQQFQAEALKHAQMQKAGQAGANGQPQQPQARPPGQQQPPQPPMPGQKRAAGPQSVASDDVMEIPNPNAPSQQMNASQAPPQQTPMMSQQQPGMPMPPNLPPHLMQQWQAATPEQRNKLLGELNSLKQKEAMKRAQMGMAIQQQNQPRGQQAPVAQPQNLPAVTQTPAWRNMTKVLGEVEKANTPKGPEVYMSDADMQQARVMLRNISHIVPKIQTTWSATLQKFPELHELIRATMKAKIQAQQNVTDLNGTIKDYLSLDMKQLKTHISKLQEYHNELRKVREQEAAASQKNQQVDEAPAAAPQQQPPPPLPPQQAKQRGSTVNKPQQSSTQQQQQQQSTPQMSKTPSQQNHNRKASSNPKAPPAPTEHKTFDWGAPSPHGIPKYDANRADLTPDKLKMPASKKRRVDDPSPAASTPEQRIKCADALCDAHFRDEADLHKHMEAEHKPIEDPLAFLLEQASGALEVPAISKQDTAAAIPTAPIKAQEKTLRDAVEEKMGFSPFLAPAVAPPAPQTFESDDFTDMLQATLGNLAGMQDDWALGLQPAFSDSTSSPPELTPPSSDVSGSESLRINMEWDAFGDGGLGSLGLGEVGNGGNGMLGEWDELFGPEAGLEGEEVM